MTAPRFLLTFTLCAAGLTALDAAFNVLIDPDGLFPSLHLAGVDRSDRYYGHERIGKLYELESHPDVDGVLLGGSRVAYQDSAELGKIAGGHWYNFGLANFNVREIPAYARRVTERPQIKTLVIGLAFYSFSLNDGESATVDPDMVAGSPLGRFKHLLDLTLSWDRTVDSARVLYRTFRPSDKKNRAVQSYDSWGNRIRGAQDEDFRKAGWKKVRDHFDGQYKRFKLDYGRLDSLRAVRDEMAARGVRLIFFVPPVSQELLDLIALHCPEAFKTWKSELAKISDYWDFTEPSGGSADADNFYDPSHAKASLGRWIFGRIWSLGDDIPADFGRHVERIAE